MYMYTVSVFPVLFLGCILQANCVYPILLCCIVIIKKLLLKPVNYLAVLHALCTCVLSLSCYSRTFSIVFTHPPPPTAGYLCMVDVYILPLSFVERRKHGKSEVIIILLENNK